MVLQQHVTGQPVLLLAEQASSAADHAHIVFVGHKAHACMHAWILPALQVNFSQPIRFVSYGSAQYQDTYLSEFEVWAEVGESVPFQREQATLLVP